MCIISVLLYINEMVTITKYKEKNHICHVYYVHMHTLDMNETMRVLHPSIEFNNQNPHTNMQPHTFI